jgi:Zn finger protein HypA/HybF involved in hydrogenase expression
MKESFTDPVVRCTDCQRLITRAEIRKYGLCPDCGNKRVRNVLVLSGKEVERLKEMDIDPAFLAEFTAVDNG